MALFENILNALYGRSILIKPKSRLSFNLRTDLWGGMLSKQEEPVVPGSGFICFRHDLANNKTQGTEGGSVSPAKLMNQR